MVTASADPGTGAGDPEDRSRWPRCGTRWWSRGGRRGRDPDPRARAAGLGPRIRSHSRPGPDPAAGRGAARRRAGDGGRLHRPGGGQRRAASSAWSASRSPSSPSCSSSRTTARPERRSSPAARTSSPPRSRPICSCRTPGHSARSRSFPRAEDLRDYVRLARRGLDTLGRRSFRAQPVASPEMPTQEQTEARGGKTEAPARRSRRADVQKTLPDPDPPDRLVQGASGPSVRSAGVPGARGPARRLVRRPPRRVLRHRRPQRLREEHAAQDPGEHLPRRRRLDPDGGPPAPVHRAGGRFQPRADAPARTSSSTG